MRLELLPYSVACEMLKDDMTEIIDALDKNDKTTVDAIMSSHDYMDYIIIQERDNIGDEFITGIRFIKK